MKNLSNIQRESVGCNKEVVIRIESYSSCYDNMTQQLFSGANGFKKILNLRGYIRAIPREIERTISFNCKTQKVRSATQYLIQSSDAFPEWKMREIEDNFSLETIVIDGYKIIHRGGSLFEKINNTCPFLYRFSATVEECPRQQIHGCESDCSTSKDNVFIIPDKQIRPVYFNSQGQQIASSFSQLLDWYRVQTGVTVAEEISVQIDCLYYKVFRVRGTGIIPSVFYYDAPLPNNKVSAYVIDLENDDVNRICNGVNNNLCGLLMIDTPTVYEIECGDLTIGTPTVFIIGQNCDVEAVGNWTESGTNEIVSVGNSKTMTLKLQSSVYVEPPPPSGTTFNYTSNTQSNCAIPTNIPADAIIIQVRRNGVVQSGGQYSFNPSNGIITLTNCLNTGDNLQVDFSFTTFPSISEVVARITGTQCYPKQMYMYNNQTNPQIPVGSTLVLYQNGDIKWVGYVPFADNSGSLIQIDNIYYETL